VRLSATIERALVAGGVQAVAALARERRGPIVEPAGDPATYEVTFVFADRARRVGSAGLFCPALPGGFGLLRPLGDHLFAGTWQMPRGARVKYHFCPDPPPAPDAGALFDLEHAPSARRVDPFNPHIDVVSIPELRLRIVESVLALPGARPGPAGRRADVPAGTVATETIRSDALGADRRVSIYRPHGYRLDAGPYPLVVLLDGQQEWWRAPALFDSLIADGASVPFVAALVGIGRFSARLRELAGSPDHVRFVALELLPWLRTRCAIAAAGHVVAGFSAAALGAAYVALQEPERFARLVAVSGAFDLTTRSDPLRPSGGSAPWLVGEYERAERLPRTVFLAAGAFEGPGEPSILVQSAMLAEVSRRRGVAVRFVSAPTGHDTVSARAHLGDGLAWTLGAPGGVVAQLPQQ
jgi:enterochelin esterase-like enzyme